MPDSDSMPSVRRKPSPINPGDIFGRWTAIEPVAIQKQKPKWRCRCSCGTVKLVYERYLIVGSSTSCGCFMRELTVERNTKHGHNARGKRTTEYNSWAGMKARCLDPANPEWPNYGGRGIAVCDEWKDDFERFLSDMGPKPSPRYQIDRIDNEKGYEAGNCRWATPKENASNQRRTVFLEHEGKRLTQNEWARVTGLSPATICERRAAGWTDEQVLTRPRTPGRKYEQ